MGSSIATNQPTTLSQGDRHFSRDLEIVKNKKCIFCNRKINSGKKVKAWLTLHSPNYNQSVVRFERNIPCRSARRFPPVGFHSGYLKKPPCTPDAKSTSLSLSTKDDTSIIESNILNPDAKTNKYVFLQKYSTGHYYLSNITGKTIPLSDIGNKKECLEWVVGNCLHYNLNEPIEFMIKNGVFKPNDSNFKEPIIHLAISYLQKELLQFLLDGEYVDINVRNSEGDTPLIVAVLLYPTGGILEIIDLLLEYEPDLTIEDRLNKTALKNAACFIRSYEITKRLLEHHASPNEISELPAIKSSMTEQDKVEIQKIHNLFTGYRATESSTLSTTEIMV